MNTKININAIPETIPRSTSFKTINGKNIVGNGNIAAVEPRVLEFPIDGQLTEDQLNYNIETYNKIINHEKIIVYGPAAQEGYPIYPLNTESFNDSKITFIQGTNDSSYIYFELSSTGNVELGFYNKQIGFDDALSATSENAVQNKVVTAELAKYATQTWVGQQISSAITSSLNTSV